MEPTKPIPLWHTCWITVPTHSSYSSTGWPLLRPSVCLCSGGGAEIKWTTHSFLYLAAWLYVAVVGWELYLVYHVVWSLATAKFFPTVSQHNPPLGSRVAQSGMSCPFGVFGLMISFMRSPIANPVVPVNYLYRFMYASIPSPLPAALTFISAWPSVFSMRIA